MQEPRVSWAKVARLLDHVRAGTFPNLARASLWALRTESLNELTSMNPLALTRAGVEGAGDGAEATSPAAGLGAGAGTGLGAGAGAGAAENPARRLADCPTFMC